VHKCRILLGGGWSRETRDPPLRRTFEARAGAEAAPSAAGAVKRRRCLHRLNRRRSSVSDSTQKQTGVTSVSRPFRRKLSVDYLICVPTHWMPQQPHNVPSRRQRAMAKHWPICGRWFSASLVANSPKQQFIDNSLTLRRYNLPTQQASQPCSAKRRSTV
jgi:hypothetical protein